MWARLGFDLSRSSRPLAKNGHSSPLRNTCIKIGAKFVRHGRYITIQMVEVDIPRPLFAEILRLIDGLRPVPFAAMTGLGRDTSRSPDRTCVCRAGEIVTGPGFSLPIVLPLSAIGRSHLGNPGLLGLANNDGSKSRMRGTDSQGIGAR